MAWASSAEQVSAVEDKLYGPHRGMGYIATLFWQNSSNTAEMYMHLEYFEGHLLK